MRKLAILALASLAAPALAQTTIAPAGTVLPLPAPWQAVQDQYSQLEADIAAAETQFAAALADLTTAQAAYVSAQTQLDRVRTEQDAFNATLTSAFLSNFIVQGPPAPVPAPTPTPSPSPPVKPPAIVPAPPAPVPAVSPDGAQVAAGASATLVNALGVWAFDNTKTRYDGTLVTLNNKPSGGGTDYGGLLYMRAGVIYVRDISQWWKWDVPSGDFVAAGGTATDPAPPK